MRARRRTAYVDAVARRSTVRERADVQAYLGGYDRFAGRAVHPYGAEQNSSSPLSARR